MHNKTKQSLISLELLSNIISYDEISKKKLSYQIRPCCKQVNLIIIGTNYDGPKTPRLHTMFCGSRSTGSGVFKDF